jgi:tripartite motif-containing protein 71
MKRLIPVLPVVLTLAASAAYGGFSYAGQWGEQGTAFGEFNNPCGLGYGMSPGGLQGIVYVVDRGNWRVQYFTNDGSFLGTWGSYGQSPGNFRWPMGLEVHPNGNVYVADNVNNWVAWYTWDGTYIDMFEVPGATDVAIAPNGIDIYIASGINGNNCVYHCDVYGTVIGKWGYEGSGPGEFKAPCGLAVALNGDVYVSDSDNDRIQYFTSGGSLLGMWGSFGTGQGQFSRPWGIAVDRFSRVFVADHKNSRVQYFTSTGNFLGIWGNYGSGNGEFIGTDDIVLTPDSLAVYVSDYGNHRIQYFFDDGSTDASSNPGAPVNISPASVGKIKALFN